MKERNSTTNTDKKKKPHGKDRVAIDFFASQKDGRALYELTQSINADSSSSATTSSHEANPPQVYQEELFSLEELQGMPPQDETKVPSRTIQPHAVHLSFYDPDADKQPEFINFAEHFLGRSWLMALEALAHLESPVKNDRSQKFIDKEDRLRIRYKEAHPGMTNKQYKAIRTKQLADLKLQTAEHIAKKLYPIATERYRIVDEIPIRHLSRHIDTGTKAIDDIHSVVYPHEESPLLNEVQLKSISLVQDIMTYLSPNTDPKLREQIKHIYLNADTSALIESLNPHDEAGRKLAMIQRLLDKELFEGLTGHTESRVVRALFDDQTTIRRIVNEDEQILIDDLPAGWQIKQRELPIRTMKGTDIKLYTTANEKSASSSIVKAFKKASQRVERGGADDLDPIHDVTDTYRIKFTIAGEDEDIEKVMDRVLDILIDPKNKRELLERDEYGRAIRTKIYPEIIEDIEDDSTTNRTKDQANDVVFRKRIQVKFADLTHPVEIMFQTMEEFFRGEYNIGEYDKDKGKYTGAAHDLYDIARSLPAVNALFNPAVYKGQQYADHATSAKDAMDNKARELRFRDTIFTAQKP